MIIADYFQSQTSSDLKIQKKRFKRLLETFKIIEKKGYRTGPLETGADYRTVYYRPVRYEYFYHHHRHRNHQQL